jgi:3-oxoacyl-[acyl-carrier protein] reductase
VDLGIEGRASVVTGASRGIGLATAVALRAEGARVLLVARSEESLAAAVATVGGESAGFPIDVTEARAAEAILAECERRFGGLDVLVNNAGTSRARALDELTDEEWDEQWQLHVMASMRLMRAAVPRMVERGWGRVVNVGSSSGKRPSLSNPAYSVSKAAQLALSRVFADTYAAKGVLVNAVAPGPVETPLWMAEGGLADQAAERSGVTREEALEAARGKIPIGRFGTPDEIAAVIAFLCSERASDVAGSTWSVDGGAVPLFI